MCPFENTPRALEEAAWIDGAGFWQGLVRIVLPTLGNYFIGLFKDTALCSVVSIQEVVFTAQILAARNFQYFTLYTIVGIMYFALPAKSLPVAAPVNWKPPRGFSCESRLTCWRRRATSEGLNRSCEKLTLRDPPHIAMVALSRMLN